MNREMTKTEKMINILSIMPELAEFRWDFTYEAYAKDETGELVVSCQLNSHVVKSILHIEASTLSAKGELKDTLKRIVKMLREKVEVLENNLQKLEE